MECIDVPRRRWKNLNKRRSVLQDYVQPARRRPLTYNRPYKKPTIKIESGTTYSRSYMKIDCASKPTINYGIHEKIVANKPGRLDFDTVYKLSYHALDGKVRKPFFPRSCLSINGYHDMTTTHMLSYANPGYSKATLCEPYRGKTCHPVSMDDNTVTKESYQDFGGSVEVKRPSKGEFWQTKSKTDYHTTSQLSYQYSGPISKRTSVAPYRPTISAQIEKDTVYSTSYNVPGHFVNKENVISV